MVFDSPVPFELWNTSPSGQYARDLPRTRDRYYGTIDIISIRANGRSDNHISVYYHQRPNDCHQNTYDWYIDDDWYASVGGIVLHGKYTENQLRVALAPLIETEERNTL